jgi:hypothetical protein
LDQQSFCDDNWHLAEKFIFDRLKGQESWIMIHIQSVLQAEDLLTCEHSVRRVRLDGEKRWRVATKEPRVGPKSHLNQLWKAKAAEWNWLHFGLWKENSSS